MQRVNLLVLPLLVFGLVSCRSSGGDDDHHHVDPPPPPPPELEAFHMVDSYGVSTEDDPFAFLALNPYIDNGFFEIYWYVDNQDDYTVDILINDAPTFADARLISSDYCGPGLACDLDGIQFCEYNADFTITCDPPEEDEPGRFPVRFDDLIFEIPQTMYFILDVCDTNSDICEAQILDVEME